MKTKSIMILALALLAIPAGAQDSVAPGQTPPATQKDKVSYCIGVQVAKTLKAQGIDIDPELLIRGLQACLSGQKFLMCAQQLTSTIFSHQQEATEKQTAERAKAADENKK